MVNLECCHLSSMMPQRIVLSVTHSTGLQNVLVLAFPLLYSVLYSLVAITSSESILNRKQRLQLPHT